MANNGALEFLKTMNRLNERDATIDSLAELFERVAKAADKVADVDTKVDLKMAAATGKEKLQTLKKLL